ASGVTVVARLADDPGVSATLVTDVAGSGVLTSLPNRPYNVRAEASGNRIATQSTSVFDGTVVLRLLTFNPASPIDNNDFSQGTAGWEIGTAPVAIVPHMEDAPFAAAPLEPPQGRNAGASEAFEAVLARPGGEPNQANPDFDLVLNTSGEGQQSISRTFAVEAGVKSVAVRYRFITSEVPGGWFGSEFNAFFNVSIRSLQAGDSVNDGNSMNGLGLAAFTPNGATAWFEAELQVAEAGDTVQF
ncbi:MAG: hypothetical protein GY778_27695, partial [bacterium]|nr:hypothetical protein [bacterium]